LLRREGDVDAAVDGLIAVVDAAQHGQNLTTAGLHGHQGSVGQVLGRVDLADVRAGKLLGQTLELHIQRRRHAQAAVGYHLRAVEFFELLAHRRQSAALGG
jgi:hypothetical protein